MEHSADSQPRDSRLEKFSAAASHIISVERGLTPTALSKIRYLAVEQRLSENQVDECLDRIGDGDSTLGRVGRYEQIFLDRMDTELSATRGAVLSPKTAQEAIRLATDEYKIGVARAQQLLNHVAKERGLQQISATDAQHRIRRIITQKFESSHIQREDFENELVAHASNFGISADEVGALLDTEVEARNQQRTLRNGRLIAASASILIGLCVAVAGCWLWLNTQPPALLNQTTTEPIVDSNTVEIDDAATETIADVTAGSQNIADEATTGLALSDPKSSRFEIDEFFSLPNTAPVLRFEKWRARFVELVGQDFEQPLPDTTPPPSADRQKKKGALDALQSEKSVGRIQTRALDDLGALAQRIDDITPKEAESIAAFCFRKHGASIENSILRNVKQFGRWPHFLLAVSDAFAVNDQQSSTDGWNQRIAFAITDGKMKNRANLSASFLAMARLRVQELLSEHARSQAGKRTNIEDDFIGHLRLFISDSMNTQHHQRYFNRLIDTRTSERSSMRRQIELQQILIEALLFAKFDDVSLAVGETHFQRLNSATTLGAQLIQSRETAVKLVSRHLKWLKRSTSVLSLQKWQPVRLSAVEARRLRNEAESIVMSGDDAQFANAVAKYRTAIDCGDRAIIRSCLRGLIAIAKTQTDRHRYQRQLDFVNGGQQGPCARFASSAGDDSSTQTALQAIKSKCRQLRRSSTSGEISTTTAVANDTEIWAALNALANRTSPRTIFELDLLLRIEAEATEVMRSREAQFSSIQLPWTIQATLPPVKVTPLVPLLR